MKNKIVEGENWAYPSDDLRTLAARLTYNKNGLPLDSDLLAAASVITCYYNLLTCSKKKRDAVIRELT